MGAFYLYEPRQFDFTTQTNFVINHNYRRKVSVQVFINDEEISCDIIAVDNNNVNIVLNEVASGYVIIG